MFIRSTCHPLARSAQPLSKVNILSKTLLTDKGKHLVRGHSDTSNAQKTHAELQQHASKSRCRQESRSAKHHHPACARCHLHQPSGRAHDPHHFRVAASRVYSGLAKVARQRHARPREALSLSQTLMNTHHPRRSPTCWENALPWGRSGMALKRRS